jgi:hypothetical protein
MEDTKYNGWTNHATWNVALWIGGDEGLYNLAKDFNNYNDFKNTLSEIYEGEPHKAEIAFQTPDGVSWNDSGLDIAELDEMIQDL